MRPDPTPVPELARAWRSTLLAFLAPLLLYAATLAPTIYNLDSAELTTAAYTGGLLRATGYPLYLLIGRAWSRLPVGDVGYRMNLLSAVCAALTLAVLDRVLQRLRVGPWARFGALGLLATSHFFWALSLVAEVYTLHTLMLALILLALLRWQERPTPQRLALATLLTGLAFGNHGATVLVAPGALWFVLRVAGRRALSPRSLALAAGGLLAGLAVYLYLPYLYLQDPVFNYVGEFDRRGVFHAIDLTRAEGLLWLVSGRKFSGAMFAYAPGELMVEIGHFLGELWRAFFAVGIGPGLLGVTILWRRQRSFCEALGLISLATAGFYIGYRVIDKNTMFLPVWVVWSLWVGVGFQWLLDWLARQPVERRWPAEEHSVKALRGLLAASVLVAGLWGAPLANLSEDATTYLQGVSMLSIAEPDALVVGWWNSVPLIQYLQLVEGRRPDIWALNRFLIDTDELRALVLDNVDRRPVYFDVPPGELLPELQTERVGPLYRLRRRRDAAPPIVGVQAAGLVHHSML